ncbi:hypothetical protein HPB50_028651 [Hyalomma asiaticum]|nr:hypothetical protein HPB50_028651 [Hyalomma asiaticum]
MSSSFLDKLLFDENRHNDLTKSWLKVGNNCRVRRSMKSPSGHREKYQATRIEPLKKNKTWCRTPGQVGCRTKLCPRQNVWMHQHHTDRILRLEEAIGHGGTCCPTSKNVGVVNAFDQEVVIKVAVGVAYCHGEKLGSFGELSKDCALQGRL